MFDRGRCRGAVRGARLGTGVAVVAQCDAGQAESADLYPRKEESADEGIRSGVRNLDLYPLRTEKLL